MRRTRNLVQAMMIAALAATGIAVTATPSMAGGHCPEIRGSANPLDSTHVIRTFTDIDGCQVPLRVGIGHVPWMQSVDFGYEHILARASEGYPGHESTAAAMVQWQRALLEAGAADGPLFECHYAQYKSGKQKRTMLVYVDYKDYLGYPYKGIISAYWVPGFKECPPTAETG
jgi:hypothetical protein